MTTSLCTSSQSINICHFNARSIRNKMNEISYFTKQNNIHIITISETWLGPEFSDNYFNLPNFQTVFRQDRNKNGGGVCIFVSDQLSCCRRSDLESQDLELLWVEVFLQQSPRTQYPLLIGCCYRPPNSPMHFYEKLETTLDNVVTKNILLLGDFNRKASGMVQPRFNNPSRKCLKGFNG